MTVDNQSNETPANEVENQPLDSVAGSVPQNDLSNDVDEGSTVNSADMDRRGHQQTEVHSHNEPGDERGPEGLLESSENESGSETLDFVQNNESLDPNPFLEQDLGATDSVEKRPNLATRPENDKQKLEEGFVKNADKSSPSRERPFPLGPSVTSLTVESGSFEKLRSDFLFAAKRLFVPPHSGFSIEAIQSNIIFVVGRPESGKFFSAVGLLANSKFNDRFPLEHVYRIRVSANLSDSIRAAKLIPKGAILILENFFDSGLALDELKEDRLSGLSALLAEVNRNYLLVVTIDSQKASRLPANCTRLSTDWSDANDTGRQQFLGEVVDRYIENYNSCYPSSQLLPNELDALKSLRGRMIESFRSPSQVSWLFERVSVRAWLRNEFDVRQNNDDPNSGLERFIVGIIDEIVAVENGTSSNWFSRLPVNSKLYALLVALLQKLPAEQIHRIYFGFCIQLKKEGFPIDDPRKIGIDDIRHQVFIRHDIVEELERGVGPSYIFVSSGYLDEVNRQISNYRDLLWSAVSYLIEHLDVEHKSDFLLPHIGEAIGRLGEERWHEFSKQMDTLAAGTLASIPAAALRTVVLSKPIQVLNLLREWIAERPTPTKVFSATVAIAECYQTIAESEKKSGGDSDPNQILAQLEDLLRQAILFNFPDNFLTQQIVFNYAIGRLLNSNLPRTIAYLVNWIAGISTEPPVLADSASLDSSSEIPTFELLDEDNDEEVDEEIDSSKEQTSYRYLGYLYAQWILSELSDLDQVPEGDRSLYLDLVDVVLTFDMDPNSDELLLLENDESQTDAVEKISPISHGLEVVKKWLDSGPLSEVHMHLLKTVQIMSTAQRRRLKRVLRESWLDSTKLQETRIAESLLTYANVLDGIPVDPSTHHFGCLLLGFNSRKDERSRIAASRIHDRLAAHVNLKVAGQGSVDWLEKSSDFHHSSTIKKLISGIPVAVPLLEKLDATHAHFIIVLQWDPTRIPDRSAVLTDLDDLSNSQDSFLKIREKLIVLKHVADPKLQSGWNDEQDQPVVLANLESRNTQDRIDEMVTKRIACDMARRSAEDCQSAIEDLIPDFDTWDFETLVSKLEAVIQSVDTAECMDDLRDNGRLISGIFCLMLKAYPKPSVELIGSWVRKGSSKLRVAFAKALFHLLLRYENSDSGVDFGVQEEIIDLGSVFIKNMDECSYEFVCVLRVIRKRIAEPGLKQYLFSEVGRERVGNMICRLPLPYHSQVLLQIDRWVKLYEKSEADLEASQKVNTGQQIDYLNWLKTELLLGPAHPLKLREGERFSLLIVDSEIRSRTRLASVATRILSKMRREFGSRPVLFRAGISEPAAVDNEKIADQKFLPKQLLPLPQLILPILEKFPTSSIQKTIVLSDRMPLDWRDVQEYFPMGGFVYCESKNVDWISGDWHRLESTPRASPVKTADEIWEEVKRLSDGIA